MPARKKFDYATALRSTSLWDEPTEGTPSAVVNETEKPTISQEPEPTSTFAKVLHLAKLRRGELAKKRIATHHVQQKGPVLVPDKEQSQQDSMEDAATKDSWVSEVED